MTYRPARLDPESRRGLVAWLREKREAGLSWAQIAKQAGLCAADCQRLAEQGSALPPPAAMPPRPWRVLQALLVLERACRREIAEQSGMDAASVGDTCQRLKSLGLIQPVAPALDPPLWELTAAGLEQAKA